MVVGQGPKRLVGETKGNHGICMRRSICFPLRLVTSPTVCQMFCMYVGVDLQDLGPSAKLGRLQPLTEAHPVINWGWNPGGEALTFAPNGL